MPDQMRIDPVLHADAVALVAYMEEKFPGVRWTAAALLRWCARQGLRTLQAEQRAANAPPPHANHCPRCGYVWRPKYDVQESSLCCPDCGHRFD